MHGACPTVLQGGNADGGGPVRTGVGNLGQLYGIERAASDGHLDAPARQRLRQKQARPMLEKLHAYLQKQQAAALPKSPLGAAIGYALRNWVALTRYTEDGRLKIDNNGAEQALRPDRVGPEELALRRERSSGAPNRYPVFAGADLQASADQSVRVSARCHRACLDASGAAGPGTDATRVEASAPGFGRTNCRLNGTAERATNVSCPYRCSPKTGRACSSSSSTLASFRSAVSKPSVNHL